jgi:hypothetical protein
MITISDLQKALLELLQEIKNTKIKLIIGGGFGIYLRTEHIRRQGYRTLLSEWPEPRSTNDLDLFIRPELLIHPENLKPMALAIRKLGYKVVVGAEKYQFVKPGPGGGEAGSIKIDILTGPQAVFSGTKVKADKRRARPNPSIDLHAHPVDEAPTLEYELLSIPLEAKMESGDILKTEIHIPHPYTFLMMKLFAFRDRINDPEKDYGRYHALDLYTILATTTENEWNQALEVRDKMMHSPQGEESARIVSEFFSEPNRMGIIRLRESPYYRPELMLNEFISAWAELFGFSNHSG